MDDSELGGTDVRRNELLHRKSRLCKLTWCSDIVWICLVMYVKAFTLRIGAAPICRRTYSMLTAWCSPWYHGTASVSYSLACAHWSGNALSRFKSSLLQDHHAHITSRSLACFTSSGVFSRILPKPQPPSAGSCSCTITMGSDSLLRRVLAVLPSSPL